MKEDRTCLRYKRYELNILNEIYYIYEIEDIDNKELEIWLNKKDYGKMYYLIGLNLKQKNFDTEKEYLNMIKKLAIQEIGYHDFI